VAKYFTASLPAVKVNQVPPTNLIPRDGHTSSSRDTHLRGALLTASLSFGSRYRKSLQAESREDGSSHQRYQWQLKWYVDRDATRALYERELTVLYAGVNGTRQNFFEDFGVWKEAPVLTGTTKFEPLPDVKNIMITGGAGFM